MSKITTDSKQPSLGAEQARSQIPEQTPGQVSLAKQARIFFFAIAALVLTAMFFPRGDGTSTAPAGFLLDATGRPTTIGNHFTPVSLLHFWATWCPPCITEIPALERLSQDFAQEPGFQIMMVAVDDDPEKVRPFVGRNRAFSVLFDPQWEVTHRYGTRKLPETYVVIRGRTVKSLKFVGATNWDDPKIRAALQEVIRKVEAGEELQVVIDAAEALLKA